MPQKKSTTTKRKTTSKRITKKQQEVINQTRAQLLSVVLLAVGILYLALAFIEGESLWRGLHNIFFCKYPVRCIVYIPFVLQLRPSQLPLTRTNRSEQRLFREVLIRGDFRTPRAHAILKKYILFNLIPAISKGCS